MFVERTPQAPEAVPVGQLVSLQPDPVVLRVAGEHQVGPELGLEEPVMVLRGRVDEMPDDLSRGPLAAGRTPARLLH
jgi:hypothetical protein